MTTWTRVKDWLNWRQSAQVEESKERIIDRSEEQLKKAIESSAKTHDLLSDLTYEMQRRGYKGIRR